MFFIQSSIGMVVIFPIFFILFVYFLFFVHMQSRTVEAAMLSLLALGIVLGIGISAKWIVLAAWASIVFFLLLRLVLHSLDVQWGPPMTPRVPPLAYVAAGVIALVAIPLVIYLLSWYSFFARGQFHNLGALWNYQLESYRYPSGLTATHPYGSPAWSSPF